MTEPRQHALTIEAKKHAYRQTQDGVVIAFVVHPDDVDPVLASAPLGTRYTVALVQMSDENEPVGGPTKTVAWEQMANSQQAGIRCNDDRFKSWVARQSPKTPENFVRDTCGVKSRRELDEGSPATKWQQLDAQFRKEIAPKL